MCLFLHARRAWVSLRPRINALSFTTGDGADEDRLPAPENVALDGEPNTDGCGDGAALHESPVEQTGGATGTEAKQGAPGLHSCAS